MLLRFFFYEKVGYFSSKLLQNIKKSAIILRMFMERWPSGRRRNIGNVVRVTPP